MGKISIAMTTYNGEKFVEKQLQSLVEQTRSADEVIIYDDCSKDKTPEIVSGFIRRNKLTNWNFFVNQTNQGYKRNFYNAISKTTGDIIFLSDQDDMWYPNKIKTIENIFLNNNQVKAVNTGFDFIDKDDKTFHVRGKYHHANNNIIKKSIRSGYLEQIAFTTICGYNISPGCTMAFRRGIKEIYLQKSVCRLVHDWEINYIAACLDGLFFYNKPLVKYRIHSNNAIGLSEEVAGDGMNGANYYVRLAKAKCMYEYYTEPFQKYMELLDPRKVKIMKRQIDFVASRLRSLEEKSFFKILGLYKYRRNYINSVTWKGRMADIMCTILSANQFKRRK